MRVSIKDKLYNYFVRKNGRVWYEYERYVKEHMEEHRLHRFRHIKVLLKLNWFYRVKKGNTPYLYWDVPLEPGLNDVTSNSYQYPIQIKDSNLDMSLRTPKAKVFYIEHDAYLYWNETIEDGIYCIYKQKADDWEFVTATKNFFLKVKGNERYVVLACLRGKISGFAEKDTVFADSIYQKIEKVNIQVIELDGQIALMWKKLYPVLSFNVYLKSKNELQYIDNVQGQGITIDNLKNEQLYTICLRCVYEGKEKNEIIVEGKPHFDQSSISERISINNEKKMLLKKCMNNEKKDTLIMSESVYKARAYPHVLVKSLLQFDVIVFDIFDTVIFRPFQKASDLFTMLEAKFMILNFKEIRIKAEKNAREKKRALFKNDEVTIDDIYLEIQNETGVDASYGAKIEFELETEMCYANPYMARVIEILLSLGKNIVFASDMYYSQDQLKIILKKCGIQDNATIYSSSDYLESKRNGALFRIIMRDCGMEKRYFLIDDKLANIKAARDYGWNRHQYINVSEVGINNRLCINSMSDIIGSAYAGIVNSKLLNGIEHYSEAYEYGYKCGGIYILGFCNWLNEQCKKEKFDKIIFVSRDGSIYKECYDEYFRAVKTEYLYWSRLVASRITWEYNKNIFFDLTLYSHINKLTINELFHILGIYNITNLLKKYRIPGDVIISSNNIEILKALFNDNWQVIFKEKEEEERLAIGYIQHVVGKASKVALVDVGWKGANLLGIDWFINERCKLNVDTKCYLAGITTNQNLTFCMSGKMKGYMFSPLHNRDLFLKHIQDNYGFNSMFFELFSQDVTPSVKGFEYDEKGFKILFSLSEPENKKMILDIKCGILDFIEDYITHFRNYDYMINISGRDAYMPFSYFMGNTRYLINYLSDYRFCRELYSGPSNESIAEIMLNNIRGKKVNR